jgi:hypothetical protein
MRNEFGNLMFGNWFGAGYCEVLYNLISWRNYNVRGYAGWTRDDEDILILTGNLDAEF